MSNIGVGVITDLANSINKLENNDTIRGINMINNKERRNREAILAHNAKKNSKGKDVEKGNIIPTGNEIADMLNDLYR